MNKIFAFAVVAAMSATGPALAQSAGYFGAPSGHNTPGGGVDPNRIYPDYGYNNGYNGDGFGGPGYRNDTYGDGYRNGVNGDEYNNREFGYGERPNNWDNGFGVPNPSGAIEGRAAAPDDAPLAEPMRVHRRRAVEDDMDPAR